MLISTQQVKILLLLNKFLIEVSILILDLQVLVILCKIGTRCSKTNERLFVLTSSALFVLRRLRLSYTGLEWNPWRCKKLTHGRVVFQTYGNWATEPLNLKISLLTFNGLEIGASYGTTFTRACLVKNSSNVRSTPWHFFELTNSSYKPLPRELNKLSFISTVVYPACL